MTYRNSLLCLLVLASSYIKAVHPGWLAKKAREKKKTSPWKITFFLQQKAGFPRLQNVFSVKNSFSPQRIEFLHFGSSFSPTKNGVHENFVSFGYYQHNELDPVSFRRLSNHISNYRSVCLSKTKTTIVTEINLFLENVKWWNIFLDQAGADHLGSQTI